jgi:hypothetical protein
MRRDELIVALALCAASLGALALIPRYVAAGPAGGGLSPAFMPYVAAALALLSSLGMLIGGLRRRGGASSEPGLSAANLRFLGTAAAVLAACYVLMSVFGYMAGAIVLTGGLLKLARVKAAPLVVAAVAAPAALWLFFVALLDTPLP